MALMQETRGRDDREPVDCVVMVSTVNKPIVTRAGIASTEIQNATHDNITEKIKQSNRVFFIIPFNRLSNLTGCKMVEDMVDFAALFLESFLILVAHVLFCYLSCFTPQCTSSGPSTDQLTKSNIHAIWQPVKFDRAVKLNWAKASDVNNQLADLHHPVKLTFCTPMYNYNLTVFFCLKFEFYHQNS